MGDILPFVARVRASGDWTAAERARLQDLADQFSLGGARVEVVFGTTEEGDPWCVVKDDQEEVLVHVARIGGKFVVHYAAEDALEEGADLHATLSDRLVAEAAHDDVVVPFSIGGRHAQTFIALVVAAAFFYETQSVAEAAETQDEPLALQHAPEDAATLPAGEDVGVRQDRDLAANGSATIESTPAAAEHTLWSPPVEAAAAAPSALATADAEPEPAPAESARVEAPQAVQVADAAPATARNEINGTDGDDLLVGTSGADHIRGGSGADTLQGGGAGQGQLDVLDGGAGDDRIELNAQVVATGGHGADTFVIAAPVVMGEASTLLGVLTDFNEADGDRLVNARGEVLLTSRPPAPPAEAPPTTAGDIGGPPRGESLPSFTPPTILPGRQLEVDLDGDGQMDGYVVMASVRGPAIYELPAPDASAETAVTLVGMASDYSQPF